MTNIEELMVLVGKKDREAQCRLADCYAKGDGVEKNLQESIKWYKKSAAKGYVAAQINLAYAYQKGLGVKSNLKTAYQWYKKANENEENQQDKYLIVEKVISHFLELKKQVKLKDLIALYQLGFAYFYGIKKFVLEFFDIDEQTYDASLFENIMVKDESKGFKLIKKAADGQYDEAQLAMADFYLEGTLVEKNEELALEVYKVFAQRNNIKALCGLGKIYARWYEGSKNVVEAVKYYRKAALLDSEYAIDKTIELEKNELERLQGLNEEDDKADKSNLDEKHHYVEVLQLALKENTPDAMFKLGYCLYKGQGTYPDKESAVLCYKKAAKSGQADALRELAMHYSRGLRATTNVDLVSTVNLKECVIWYGKLAEKGDEEAEAQLQKINKILEDRKEKSIK